MTIPTYLRLLLPVEAVYDNPPVPKSIIEFHVRSEDVEYLIQDRSIGTIRLNIAESVVQICPSFYKGKEYLFLDNIQELRRLKIPFTDDMIACFLHYLNSNYVLVCVKASPVVPYIVKKDEIPSWYGAKVEIRWNPVTLQTYKVDLKEGTNAD